MTDFSSKRLCVIGVGLIGGSLVRALRQSGCVDEVVGCGRGRENLELAVELGVIDRFEIDPAKAAADADMVVLATPVSGTAGILARIYPVLASDAVVTDAGSTKGSVLQDIRDQLGEIPARFVAGHPVAGTEESGVGASFAELYQGRRVILTPLADTDPEALNRVKAMWEAAGAVTCEMSAEHHDEVLAATSHLPHLLAYGLVDTLATMEERRELFAYAAGGFRDFTRIASSSPDMWADIVSANRAALLPVLERYLADMQTLKSAIEKDDRTALLDSFSRAKQARDRFSRLVGRFVKPGDRE